MEWGDEFQEHRVYSTYKYQFNSLCKVFNIASISQNHSSSTYMTPNAMFDRQKEHKPDLLSTLKRLKYALKGSNFVLFMTEAVYS
jgi:hypothetical protein